jgi:hypothetical protein
MQPEAKNQPKKTCKKKAKKTKKYPSPVKWLIIGPIIEALQFSTVVH